MKIVVTGALGHIGSHLVRHLAHQFPGANIVMIDNMMTQRFPSLFNLPSEGIYNFIEADVTSMDLVPLLKDVNIVIHLAAITDAAGSFEKAALVEENNFKATHNVARACAETGARLISISSTSVYGSHDDVVSEDCSRAELKPQSPYAETKLKEEELISRFCAENGLRSIICRFGTVFGVSPGMRFHTAVNKLCWQAVMDIPLTVWRTAYNQKRPYLDLLDAARAITYIIHKDIFDGRIYNVLTQNATVQNIIDIIRDFIPDVNIRFVDNKIMNQLSYEVLCDRFTAHGFAFEGSLDRGIGETIELLGNANTRSDRIRTV